MQFLNKYMSDYTKSKRWEFLMYGVLAGLVAAIIIGKIF